MTFLPEEKGDAQEMIDLIKKKTNNARKINVVELDLRKEEECKKLVENHLAFHGSLDAMYVLHNASFAYYTDDCLVF